MLFELVVVPAAEAFLDVTVFVASMIGLFGLLQWRYGDRLARFLAARWRAGPLLGAVAGVFPGCGGAVLVMPLYVRGQVSFGTVVAALVATMGDSSFVILAADPGLAVVLHAVLFVTGLVCGYAVDAVGWSPRTRQDAAARLSARATTSVSSAPPVASVPPGAACCRTPLPAPDLPAPDLPGHGHHDRSATGGDGPGSPPPGGPHGLRLGHRLGARASDTLGPVIYWLLVTLGALLVVPVLLQPEVDTIADRFATGPADLGLLVGLAGTVTAGVLAWRERRARRDGRPRRETSEVVEVLHATAFESARIAVWVTVAFVGMAVVAELGLSMVALASLAGLGGVLAGAALGLVPGCAPQIVLTGLYASGGLPLPTLLANALSQDGDALLPLLLMDRRSAVAASVLTTVPGLLVGALALAVGLGA
ncbi:putative manganese transporter [Egicoccus halophilus]|uniref:Uncharacterized protein n=1 Tax=Egicoccus halophilus TaxID=1670830 RepID=A0A8J3A740_9ACTN|nr:putative manganese transporter [Egicoccus halophilus]GGI05158.1 hypothetical protein GCM10011354_12700 [Egicoccus halophilus]